MAAMKRTKGQWAADSAWMADLVVKGWSPMEIYRHAAEVPEGETEPNRPTVAQLSFSQVTADLRRDRKKAWDASGVDNAAALKGVLERLHHLAEADRRTVRSWGPDGVTILDSDALTEEDASLVTGVTHKVSESVSADGQTVTRVIDAKLETVDPLAALKELRKHYAPVVVNVNVDRVDVLAAAAEMLGTDVAVLMALTGDEADDG